MKLHTKHDVMEFHESYSLSEFRELYLADDGSYAKEQRG